MPFLFYDRLRRVVAPSSLRRRGAALLARSTTVLQAEDLSLNLRRAYQLEVGRDLFGLWRVEVTFGRIGGRGRTVSYPVEAEDEARRLARSCLRRRASAPRRLGVPYRELSRFDPDGWLSA